MNRFRGFLPAMLTGFVVTVFAMAPDPVHAAGGMKSFCKADRAAASNGRERGR